jgi:hypothetical protein
MTVLIFIDPITKENPQSVHGFPSRGGWIEGQNQKLPLSISELHDQLHREVVRRFIIWRDVEISSESRPDLRHAAFPLLDGTGKVVVMADDSSGRA